MTIDEKNGRLSKIYQLTCKFHTKVLALAVRYREYTIFKYIIYFYSRYWIKCTKTWSLLAYYLYVVHNILRCKCGYSNLPQLQSNSIRNFCCLPVLPNAKSGKVLWLNSLEYTHKVFQPARKRNNILCLHSSS